MPVTSGASPYTKNPNIVENSKDISFNNVNPVNLYSKYDLDKENLVHVNQLDVFQTAQKNIEPCVQSLRKKSARGVKPIANKGYTNKLGEIKPSDIRSLSKDNKKLVYIILLIY